jgi:hypothetical protein
LPCFSVPYSHTIADIFCCDIMADNPNVNATPEDQSTATEAMEVDHGPSPADLSIFTDPTAPNAYREANITAEAVVKQINEMLADSPPSASVGEDGDSTSGNITIIRNEFFGKLSHNPSRSGSGKLFHIFYISVILRATIEMEQ